MMTLQADRPALVFFCVDQPGRTSLSSAAKSPVCCGNPCFIHGYEMERKFVRNLLEQRQTLLRSRNMIVLWSIRTKRRTYPVDSFLIPKCSLKIDTTVQCYMLIVSISTFTLRSANTTSWNFSIAQVKRAQLGVQEIRCHSRFCYFFTNQRVQSYQDYLLLKWKFYRKTMCCLMSKRNCKFLFPEKFTRMSTSNSCQIQSKGIRS